MFRYIDAQFERIHDIQDAPDMTSYACTLNHSKCGIRVNKESRRQVKRTPLHTYVHPSCRNHTRGDALPEHSPLYVWPPTGRAGFQVVSNEKMSLVAFWTGTATANTAVVRTTTVEDQTHEDSMLSVAIRGSKSFGNYSTLEWCSACASQ